VEAAVNCLGRISAHGDVAEFAHPTGVTPIAITGAPDRAVWFTEGTGDRIGRLAPRAAADLQPCPAARTGQ
jgi:virginiamycin B lyase